MKKLSVKNWLALKVLASIYNTGFVIFFIVMKYYRYSQIKFLPFIMYLTSNLIIGKKDLEYENERQKKISSSIDTVWSIATAALIIHSLILLIITTIK